MNLIVLCCFILFSTGIRAKDRIYENQSEIWNQFVTLLEKNQIESIPIKLHDEMSNVKNEEMHRGFLKNMAKVAKWNEWKVIPKIHLVEDNVVFVTRLSEGSADLNTYVFTFFTKNKKWYYRHLEALTVDLSQIPTPPTDVFPDISASHKHWMQEEIKISEKIKMYNFIKAQKNRDFALNWFNDGKGYLMMTKAWVPYFPAKKAFILFLCWSESKMKGNHVKLLDLSETKAKVQIQAQEFMIFSRSSHLSQMIDKVEFRELYEMQWQNRAKEAGFKLNFEYEKNDFVTFVFQAI